MKRLLLGLLVIAAMSALTGARVSGAAATTQYRVRIFNLTSGQPLSPPVAATHKTGITMFQVGRRASNPLEAIAEDGNQAPMVALFSASSRVTQVVDVGRPLTPIGKTVVTPDGTFTPTATFTIGGAPGDFFSLATMLICTNDGFTGLDRAALPASGLVAYVTNGYDSGTEDNTEVSQDLVDPCSGLGPVTLPGDPDGNIDDAVNTTPPQLIQHHPGISGVGELTVTSHGWLNPVMLVLIERL